MSARIMVPPAVVEGDGKSNPLELAVNQYLIARTRAIQRLLDPPNRDINKECGYPENPGIEDYRDYYDREGIATRVVGVFPDECWSVYPELYEIADENQITPFEEAFDILLDRMNLWYQLHRIDELSGIGQCGILLLGIAGSDDLSRPVEGIDPVTGFPNGRTPEVDPNRLLYMMPFDQSLFRVKRFEASKASPRLGQPTMYEVQLLDPANSGSQANTQVINYSSVDVHWTRVLHVADNRGASNTFGTPRMQRVINRLYDLRKILSSSAEMFWKGGFPGISFETTPESNTSDFEIDKESLKGQIYKYMNGLQRYLALEGVTAKPLLPQIADPSKHIQEQLQAIALSLGIPYRIFLGSEAAHLASTQDIGTWNKRLYRRQTTYITPWLIRPLVDRLVMVGVLPKYEKRFKVDWVDLNSMTDMDRADVSLKRAQSLLAYVTGNIEQVIPPLEFLTTIVGLPLPLAQAVVKSAKENTDGTMLTKKTMDAATAKPNDGNRTSTPSNRGTAAKAGSGARP